MAILLLVIWGPVPWTQRLVTIAVFTAAAYAWLEWIRRRTVEEFPDVPAGEWWRRTRAGMAKLRSGHGSDGDPTMGEFKRQKSALLSRT